MDRPDLTGVVCSVQVGKPRPLPWRDGSVPSAIVKRDVSGSVALSVEGLEGDAQADLTVHGGPDKAVCCYSSEHGDRWAPVIGGPLPAGGFGENFTLEGLTEPTVHIGDEFTVGTARVQVSQPRGPCYKLAARWKARELPALMAKELISGFYLRTLTPGVVEAGDDLTLYTRRTDVSVAEVMRVTYVDRHDVAGLRAVLEIAELASQWRDGLVRLERRASS